jgi:uncharacterized protein
MKMNLNDLEIRILGCLMEKELTTPENYPLSLNTLVSACNQKSNRDPVTSLSEAEILRGLETLGSRGLARLTTTGGRVAKYCHSATDKLRLATESRALLAELMLRGPQSAGELRTRGERMFPFADIAAVEAVLVELQQAAPPFIIRLPRQAGRKEVRYAQVFAGLPEFTPEELDDAPVAEARAERAPARERVEQAERTPGRESTERTERAGRVQRLEAEIGVLRGEATALRREVEEMLAQFA